jgi:hypothetical protein
MTKDNNYTDYQRIVDILEERYNRVVELMLEKNIWSPETEEKYDRMQESFEMRKAMWGC